MEQQEQPKTTFYWMLFMIDHATEFILVFILITGLILMMVSGQTLPPRKPLPKATITPVTTKVSAAKLLQVAPVESKVAIAGEISSIESRVVNDFPVPEIGIAAICSGLIAEAKKLELTSHSSALDTSWQAACDYWEAALQADPKSVAACEGLVNNLGSFFLWEFSSDIRDRPQGYTLDKFEEAVVHLIELHPQHYYGYYCLAYCNSFRGNTDSALEYLSQAVEKIGGVSLRDTPEAYECFRQYMKDIAKRANKKPDDWIDLGYVKSLDTRGLVFERQ